MTEPTAVQRASGRKPADPRSPLHQRVRRVRLWLRRLRQRWIRFSNPVLGPLRRRWKSSLKLRTMALTGLITGLMILVSGTFILTSVGNDLYASRRDQVLDSSARATASAQVQISAVDSSDSGSLRTLMSDISNSLRVTSSSPHMMVRRQAGQARVANAPTDFFTDAQLLRLVSPELSDAVASAKSPQYWQAITMTNERNETVPGILVGSSLTLPAGVGVYDVYIAYDLGDTQRTLSFITRTLGLTAILLMLLIGALVWTISNVVFRPIRAAANASRLLAAGEDDARMPLQNDEHFDVLSKNFNAMADTLQARIDELDDLSVMQQRFVSDVSHELRTPLTTIRLAAEVLRNQADQLEPGQQRAVEVLGDQVDRFESLLADLLEISRYDAGSVRLETESTNMVSLVTDVVAGLQPLAPSLIEVRPFGGYSPIDVDPRRIRRIVSNLIGNAIEHGENHPVVVTVDSNAGAVAITVRDWGIGMSAESVAHVFDRFWRADPSRKRTLGGTGLGLAIAQEDAAAHGGLIDVWSKLGEGTQFRVTLPRDPQGGSYVSPIALIPDDAQSEDGDPGVTGGWLRRPPWRSVREPKERP